MNERNRLILAFVLVTVGVGCGGSSDGPTGQFEGSTRLSRIYHGSELKDLLGGGSGEVEFRSHDSFRFGSTTPLPDCNVSISPMKNDEYLITSVTQFRGEMNDGQGCRARLLSDLEIPASVEGKITRNAEGELVVKAIFYPRDAPDSGQYELEFRGTKKGWL